MVQPDLGDRIAPQSSSEGWNRNIIPPRSSSVACFPLIKFGPSAVASEWGTQLKSRAFKSHCFEKPYSFLSTVSSQDFIRKCSPYQTMGRTTTKKAMKVYSPSLPPSPHWDKRSIGYFCGNVCLAKSVALCNSKNIPSKLLP